MAMVATVLRSGFIGEYLVEPHVVLVHAITRGPANNQIRRVAQVGDERCNRDIRHVITEPAAIGPAARNEAAVFEGILNLALQDIAAEYAETGEARVVWICGITRTIPGKAGARRGKVHFDEIRNEDRGDVGTAGLDTGNSG